MNEPKEAGFRIVTLIPKSEVVGEIAKYQKSSLMIISLIFLIGTLSASVVLRKSCSDHAGFGKALKFTDENFDLLIEEPSNSNAEAHFLIVALNKMIGKIQIHKRK
jgi:hypothetical protein